MSAGFATVFALAIFLNAAANVLVKLGMRLRPLPEGQGLLAVVWSVATNPAVVIGLSCFGLAFGAYSIVLNRLNLSVAYPIMTSVGFVVVGLASVALFRETVTAVQVAGMVLIAGGVWMVSAG